MGLGLPELILVLIPPVLLGLLGYSLGKKRKIGSTAGAALAALIPLIGLIIVLCSPKIFRGFDQNS